MSSGGFFHELKRRNVYRVAAAYAVVAWLLVQIGSILFPTFDAPPWVMKVFVAVVALGFPIALILAWAFEMTPEGVQLTQGSAARAPRETRTRRGLFWSLVAIGASAALVLSIVVVRQKAASPRKSVVGSTAKRAVAVLPFDNLSEDKANAYFADGMQDEIITRLAKIGDLKVISRTSTLPYRARPEKLSEIARQLGVNHVVEGSVQKIGEQVRVNVQLIDAQTDEHLWAELYHRSLADVFAVQSEIATAIAHALQAKLSGREREAVTEKPTTNLAAYDAYLRGIDFDTRLGQMPADEIAAADAFAEAVRLDPQFAHAWARLSRASSGVYFQLMDATPARRELARTAAETAARLNPGSAETLLAAAYYRYHVERDYDGAREFFERIRQEMPSSEEAIQALARIARRQSRWKDSIRLYDEASKLNPRDPLLLMDRSWTYSMLRDHPSTLRLIEQAEAIKPGDADVLDNKARYYQGVGDLAAARRVVDQLPAAARHREVRVSQYLFERRPEEAARVLEEKLATAQNLSATDRAYTRYWLGWIRGALLGDTRGAHEELTRAKADLDSLIREQPDNIFISGPLALVEAYLGNKEAALATAERAVAALPATQDPVYGPIADETLAMVETFVGEHDRAVERIERLLRTPYGAYPVTLGRLRLDPTWDPLRAHPRFQALLAGPEPQTIYN